MESVHALEPFFGNFAVVLAASVVVLFVCHRLRLSPIVGLLLTGMLIGPSGLSWISQDEVELFAEIGVVLLLFTIGLEVSLVRLRQNLRPFLVGGGMQVLLTLGVTAAIAVSWDQPLSHAIFLGFLAALSSTAIVLKSYADRHELLSPHGMLATGILLFQDFCLAPMILLVPILSGSAESTPGQIAGRVGVGLLLVTLVFILARTLVPRLMEWIVGTRIREVFILGALAFCLGMSLLTSHFGFSLALGAFLAGLVLSESEYSHQVVVEVLPFRDLFNSLFFISVGMLFSLDHMRDSGLQVLGLGLGLLLVKGVILAAVCLFMSYPGRIIMLVVFSLSQVGEFSFVLGGLGLRNGLMDEGLYQTFLGASIVTMLVTPFLIQWAPRVAIHAPQFALPGALDRLRLGRQKPQEIKELENHVIVVGYGLNGRNLSRVLRDTAIQFVVVDLDPAAVREARKQGIPIHFGDASRPEILELCGLQRATMLVVAIADPVATRHIVRLARRASDNLKILVRSRGVQEIDVLQRLGANEVIPEEFETSVVIFRRVLERYHIPANVIQGQVRILRGESYELLRAEDRTPESLDRIAEILEATLTETFLVKFSSPAAGRSLRELDLRQRSGGATVIALVRSGQPTTNPSPELKLEVNDTLVLVGNHAALQEAINLLQGSGRE